MRILISDQPDSMMPDHELEIRTLTDGLGPDTDIEVYPYDPEHPEGFLERLSTADALLTAFIPLDANTLRAAKQLKFISLNSTGFDLVDLDAAQELGIGVCAVGEYCTADVSEGAIAFIFALNKHVKSYGRAIDIDHAWDYAAAPAWPRTQEQVLGIVGFGKIGQCTARKMSNLVKGVVACDPYLPPDIAKDLGVELVRKEELLERSDIIVNHMAQTDSNRNYFDADAFSRMRRHPILINMARGTAIDESALVDALDTGVVRGYAADVLADEHPDLAHHPLVGRNDVLLTPHSSFYSASSLEDLERISAQNIVDYLCGHKDKVFRMVTP
ncbi:NAD(P)-dependent oxidoreductase [Devriesea agamarum]|uniref:NAD(P)-dependent oxidoreductase n=1 Tax=Devriesea agamarum TaxID=472569 RepID=UPI00071DABE5|nr:NAD(P)-dependent oxidoreductase [Devriesea agamarum]